MISDRSLSTVWGLKYIFQQVDMLIDMKWAGEDFGLKVLDFQGNLQATGEIVRFLSYSANLKILGNSDGMLDFATL